MKPDVMTLPFNPGAQEIEAGQSEILRYLEPHAKFKANLGGYETLSQLVYEYTIIC